VPLDLNYSEPDGANAIIALTRIPSSLPTSSPWYRGPILINPGGPGGSGIEAVMIVGGHLSAIVGPQFHLVGCRALRPSRSCPSLCARIFGQLAAERQLDELRHTNTDQTARDMLRITEAHGQEKIQYCGFSPSPHPHVVWADRLQPIEVHHFVALYNPFATFLWLASGLADLAARDGPRLFQLLKTPPFQCSDAQIAIACNDGDLVPPSLEEFQEYFHETLRAPS
ncbi:hypothetical protein L208DRAFT_1383140, partial [Tricholoma matsutake]